MEYIIALAHGNNRKVISRHEDLKSAKEAGRWFWESYTGKGSVSCIKADTGDDGEIHGQYLLYETWS